jgi:hypothetical protein
MGELLVKPDTDRAEPAGARDGATGVASRDRCRLESRLDL